MHLPDDVIEELRKRLHRVEGQLRGIERMLDDRRECRDVLTQLSAANKALEQTELRLLTAALVHCVRNPEDSADQGYSLDEVERMFTSLA